MLCDQACLAARFWAAVKKMGLSHIFYVQQSFSEISSKANAPQWRAVSAGELPATY